MQASEESAVVNTEGAAQAGGSPGSVDLNPLLDAMLEVRGATAAAVPT